MTYVTYFKLKSDSFDLEKSNLKSQYVNCKVKCNVLGKHEYRCIP